jgi:D-ribose pyranase
MKKLGILNSDISKVLADLGHMDQICIGDAGLPIPDGIKKIDLALERGLPSFIDVLRIVLADMWIEKVILAEEIKTNNPAVLKQILALVPLELIEWKSHTDFKDTTKASKAIIRTGEMTPYANIILQSNVHFGSDE